MRLFHMCVKKNSLQKYDILIILVAIYASLSRFFVGYPDPRFQIRPNEVDPG